MVYPFSEIYNHSVCVFKLAFRKSHSAAADWAFSSAASSKTYRAWPYTACWSPRISPWTIRYLLSIVRRYPVPSWLFRPLGGRFDVKASFSRLREKNSMSPVQVLAPFTLALVISSLLCLGFSAALLYNVVMPSIWSSSSSTPICWLGPSNNEPDNGAKLG